MNPLNRKMFQQPIKAQQGAYVPTIEQIMNFYQGGFDQTGQPMDTESFLRAIEATKLMNEKGFFPGEGDPLKFLFYPNNKEGILEIARQFNLPNVTSAGSQAGPEGDAYKALINQIAAEDQFNKDEQIAGIMAAAASDPSQRQQPIIDSLLREGAEPEDGIAAIAGSPETVTTEEGTVEDLPIMDVTDKLDKTDSFDPKLEDSQPTNMSEVLEKTSSQIVDTFDAINSEAGGERFTDVFKTQSQLLINKALVDIQRAKTIGVEATKEAVDFARGVIANIAPSEESVNDFYDAFETLSGVDLDPDAKQFAFLEDTELAQANREGELGKFLVGKVVDAIDTDEEGNIRTPIKQWEKMITDIKDGFKGAGDEIENAKRILGTPYQSLNEADQKLFDKYSQNPSILKGLDMTKTAIDNSINFVKEKVNTVKEIPLTEKQKISNDTDKLRSEMDDILQQYQNGDITKEEFEKQMNERNDKLFELGNKVTEQATKETAEINKAESQENITGDISNEDAQKIDDAVVAEATGNAGTVSEAAGQSVAAESVSGGTSDIIAKALQQSGYNLGAVKDPDSDALKMIYYGLQLAQTGGDFIDAATKTASDYVKNEINQRYKTKAAQQKLKGEIFKVLLAGELDILKEQAKDRKPTFEKRFNLGPFKNVTTTILSNVSNATNLSLDVDNLEDPSSLESMYVTSIYNEMQDVADKYLNAELDVPSVNQLASEAVANVNKNFTFSEEKDNILNRVFSVFGFGSGTTGKLELEGAKVSGGKQKITQEQINQLATAYKITPEAMLNLLKQQKSDTLDFSLVG